MKNISLCFIGILCAALLAGCATMGSSGSGYANYRFEAPSTTRGKQCVHQCQRSRHICHRVCREENDKCSGSAKADADNAFARYKAEQESAGQPVQKTVSDFYTDKPCLKECGCSADYRACYKMCGGTVVGY